MVGWVITRGGRGSGRLAGCKPFDRVENVRILFELFSFLRVLYWRIWNGSDGLH